MFRVWFPSVWARTKDDISLQTAILPRVKAALEEEGIEMPYAHREILFMTPIVTQPGPGGK
jgi:small-conductance mechanosensitive channel